MCTLAKHRLLNSTGQLTKEINDLGGIDDVNLFLQFYHHSPTELRLKAFFEVTNSFIPFIANCQSIQYVELSSINVVEPFVQGSIYLPKRQLRRIYNKPSRDFDLLPGADDFDGVKVLYIELLRSQLFEAESGFQGYSFLTSNSKNYPSPPAPASFDI